MKLKYQFIINEVADQMVAVAVGDDMEQFNGFIKMNDIGAQIFELLKNEITLDEIIAEMLKKHPEATEEEARETITDFTNKLIEQGVVE